MAGRPDRPARSEVSWWRHGSPPSVPDVPRSAGEQADGTGQPVSTPAPGAGSGDPLRGAPAPGPDDPLFGEPGSDFDQRRPLDPRDFSRRTLLANERTYLAWWRTGLTTLTVSIASARVVPELSDAQVRWPYTVLGVVFAVLGIACMVYAERRRRAVIDALRRGTYADADSRVTLLLSGAGAVLGVITILLILLDG